jgi:hypothetical protein
MKYLIYYCLSDETTFELNHPKFDASLDELWLEVNEIKPIILKCVHPDDTIGICWPCGEKTYDNLEIHGVDGETFDLEYQMGIFGGSFHKKSVSRADVLILIQNIKQPLSDFDGSGYFFKHW